ncbi:MAG: hypothetical protein R2788_01845 [Saprospiraceae bacterium]
MQIADNGHSENGTETKKKGFWHFAGSIADGSVAWDIGKIERIRNCNDDQFYRQEKSAA